MRIQKVSLPACGGVRSGSLVTRPIVAARVVDEPCRCATRRSSPARATAPRHPTARCRRRRRSTTRPAAASGSLPVIRPSGRTKKLPHNEYARRAVGGADPKMVRGRVTHHRGRHELFPDVAVMERAVIAAGVVERLEHDLHARRFSSDTVPESDSRSRSARWRESRRPRRPSHDCRASSGRGRASGRARAAGAESLVVAVDDLPLVVDDVDRIVRQMDAR